MGQQEVLTVRAFSILRPVMLWSHVYVTLYQNSVTMSRTAQQVD